MSLPEVTSALVYGMLSPADLELKQEESYPCCSGQWQLGGRGC